MHVLFARSCRLGAQYLVISTSNVNDGKPKNSNLRQYLMLHSSSCNIRSEFGMSQRQASLEHQRASHSLALLSHHNASDGQLLTKEISNTLEAGFLYYQCRLMAWF